MTHTSFQDALERAGNIVDYLRNVQAGAYVFPGYPAEYTNWREEQKSWQETCALFNQSYHMTELFVEGPDALTLLNYLGVNSFRNFAIDKGKQYVCCTPEGYVIGDVILFYLDENKFSLVGRVPTIQWVEFHAATGDWNVNVERDERWAMRKNPTSRTYYRFQVQGPNAMKVTEKATGATPPDIKFFDMTRMTIAGREVRALRHGMAGQAGWELFGPWEDYEAVHSALVEAGREFGMKLVGGRTYPSNTLESAWVPSPLPATYSGEGSRAYREWLPAQCYEMNLTVGGSFLSPNIEDYYLTPWDLGYGGFVKFDHDFVGRAALEAMAQQPHRQKVTLALDDNDVMRIMGSLFRKDVKYKSFELPLSSYAMHPFDAVQVNGKTVGVSTWNGYSSNAEKMLTLAMIDKEFAQPGTEVTLVWGEENGGTAKPNIERHTQTTIKAIVSPAPYSEVARSTYVEGGWRKA